MKLKGQIKGKSTEHQRKHQGEIKGNSEAELDGIVTFFWLLFGGF